MQKISTGVNYNTYTVTAKSYCSDFYTSASTSYPTIPLLPGIGRGNLIIDGGCVSGYGTEVRSTGWNTVDTEGVIAGTNVLLQNIKLSNTCSGACVTAGAAFDLLVQNATSQVSVGNYVNFGASNGGHIGAQAPGAIVYLYGNYFITAGAPSHLNASIGGIIQGVTLGSTVTITGTPYFSTAFAVAYQNSFINVGTAFVVWSGSATGARYSVSNLASIGTAGSGATYFPGSVAGYASGSASGGYYN